MLAMPALLRRLAPLAVLSLVLLLGACQSGRPVAAIGSPGAVPKDAGPGGPSTGESDPGHLRGLTAIDVTTKLGDPSYRRREPPAEVWQYFGPGCVLDLFLYDDNGTQRVTHAELRSHNLAPAAQADCLSRLLAGARGDANS